MDVLELEKKKNDNVKINPVMNNFLNLLKTRRALHDKTIIKSWNQ